MNAQQKILIVEDEGIVAFNLEQRLRHMGYEVTGLAESGAQGLSLLQSERPDLVLMDIHIKGDMDGIELASIMGSQHGLPIIYLTAYSEDTTLERAKQTRPYGYLIKPFSERELHATIQMALERHQVQMQLARSETLLQRALHAAHMGSIEIRPDDGSVHIEGEPAETLGIDPASTYPLEAFSTRFTGEAPAKLKTLLVRNSGEPDQQRIIAEVQRGPDEDSRWFQMDLAMDADACVRGVIQDITEQEHARQRMLHVNEELEHRVAERTAELERHVQEIEAFSYSAAHDLKSPLRAIIGFSELLTDKHPKALTAEETTMLAHIKEAAKRMGELIDALLTLANLSHAPIHPQPVDLSAMANDLIAQLCITLPDHAVTATVEPGIWVAADPALIRSVMDNLLRNAWKFTAKRANPTVTVKTVTRDGTTYYTVCDNGVGFDQEQGRKIFLPFFRLHSNHRYAGSGLGLNIAQRIVERHGGHMLAEGVPEEGACIGFTLGQVTPG